MVLPRQQAFIFHIEDLQGLEDLVFLKGVVLMGEEARTREIESGIKRTNHRQRAQLHVCVYVCVLS